MKRLNALFAVSLLAGCTVGPDYEEASETVSLPETLSAGHFHRDDGLWKSALPSDGLPRGDWWAVFGDETLNALLKECAENNPDLAAAYQRVEQAREAALVQKSDFYPKLNARASFSKTDYSKNMISNNGRYDQWLAGFGITWDLDLFGRVQSLLAAQARLAAYESLMLDMRANVAKAYFTLRRYKSEIDVLESTLEVRKLDTALVERRVEMDYSTQIDLKRVVQQQHEAAAQLADARRMFALSHNYLALLVGKAPAELGVRILPLGENFPAVPAAVPSELLERRPDIAEAERGVFAANARAVAAQAAFFPTVSLTANTDLSANKIEKLLNAGSFAWGISPQIYLPIFEAGRNIAQKRVALAAHREALENYRSKVLAAVREVEDALSGIAHLAEEYAQRREVVRASADVCRMARIQYDQGYTDYFSVSEAQRRELSNARELIVLRGERYNACVDLISSLGGGWKLGEPAPESAGRNTGEDFGQSDLLPAM